MGQSPISTSSMGSHGIRVLDSVDGGGKPSLHHRDRLPAGGEVVCSTTLCPPDHGPVAIRGALQCLFNTEMQQLQNVQLCCV